ncbi:MAG TPA: hypothetical protein VM597_32880 [Gemmataceae bacterium]|jgi:hypothetical protein|nr:hypothetical protein [Gemmataceae bacterium]
MRRLLYAILILPVLAVPSSSQEKGKEKKEPDPLMVAKLKHAQDVLAGITLNDLEKAEKAAEELLRISKAAQMRRPKATMAYEHHANTFQKGAETLIEKAKARNIDGATLAYVDLTCTCVRCHQYTREVAIGGLTPPGSSIGR